MTRTVRGCVTACGLMLLAFASSASAASSVTEFSSGVPAGSGPDLIAPGPDGAMWFSEYQADRIGRVASNGSITQYPTSGSLTAGANPSGIVAGPDGNIWFTEYGVGKIGEISPSSGQLVGEYPLPSGSGSAPEGIAVGPDGALWFAERGADRVGRLDPSAVSPGTSNGITEYLLAAGHLVVEPVDLVAGPDGALWVTLSGVDEVARVATTGVGTRYSLPTSGAQPQGITLGPDGKLWVAEYGSSKLAQVDPGAVSPGTSNGITEFPAGGKPLWISDAGDGALWLTDNTDGELLRFDTSSHTTSVFGSGQGVTGDATADAQDANGNLWFTEFSSGKVGEVAFPHAPLNTGPPAITGTTAVGQTVSCSTGTWANTPTGFAYQWQLDGGPIAGETAATHVIAGGEAGHQLTCKVTASNASGSASGHQRTGHAGRERRRSPGEHRPARDLGDSDGWRDGHVLDRDVDE